MSARSTSVNSKDAINRTLKFAGKNSLGIPVRRERFNEKPEEIIEEQRS